MLISNSHHVQEGCDVSFVIVSWNVADLLRNCIQSIRNYSGGLKSEIIVVDNASTDHTVEMLRKEYPEIGLIVNLENVGFARANNQGFDLANGRYIFILNPDTYFIDRSLEMMVKFLSEHPDIALLGPRLIYPDGTTQLTSARLLPNLKSTLFCDILRLCRYPWFAKRTNYPYDYDRSQAVEAISGAAMLVRNEMIRGLGGFHPSFIHVGEDVEFCFRVKMAGFKINYLSEARVVHYKGGSSRQAIARTTINAFASSQLYYRLCYGNRYANLYRLLIQGLYAPLMMVKALLPFNRTSYKQNLGNTLQIINAVYHWKTIGSSLQK